MGGDGLDGRERDGGLEDGLYGGGGCKLYPGVVVSMYKQMSSR